MVAPPHPVPAAPSEAASAAPPGPRPRLSRMPVGRAQDKRAPSEEPSVAPPQQKRSRTELGPGVAKATPRAPLRTLDPAAAAGKNDGPCKAASVAAAPRAGSVTSTNSEGASKRPPWDLRGQLGDLREALDKAQERLQRLEGDNRQLREQLEQLQRELAKKENLENRLCTRVSSLRQELPQSRRQVEALEAEEQQRRQDREEALCRAQELLRQLENTGAQLQQTQQQLQEQLELVSALHELNALQRTLLDERKERIHLLEMEWRRLHGDIQELRGNVCVVM